MHKIHPDSPSRWHERHAVLVGMVTCSFSMPVFFVIFSHDSSSSRHNIQEGDPNRRRWYTGHLEKPSPEETRHFACPFHFVSAIINKVRIYIYMHTKFYVGVWVKTLALLPLTNCSRPQTTLVLQCTSWVVTYFPYTVSINGWVPQGVFFLWKIPLKSV